MFQTELRAFLVFFLTIVNFYSTRAIDTSNELFLKCFTEQSIYAFRNNNLQEIDPVCVQYFIDQIAKEQKDLDVTEDQMNFLRSVEREGLGQIYTRKRVKRQANRGGRRGGGRPFPLLRRRECRALTDNQRNRLFNSMRYLKFNTRSNVFDFFAGLHRSLRSFLNAHIGSNFLGWHRVYLWLFERVLVRVGGQPLCYWDSTLDYEIPGTGQRNTTMFTSQVVGNGRGMVINGPFRNWPIPERNVTLRRDIASFASLMRPEVVDSIFYNLSIRNHSQISNGQGAVGMRVPSDGSRTSLESEHDNTHVWVGGVMSDATIAPQDPVFWLHHTYIDYCWEKFREKISRRLRINPEDDYPAHGGDPHAPEEPMVHFYNYSRFWTNRNGYTNLFTQLVYTYDDHPTCGNRCGGRGNTNLLYCPAEGRGNNADVRCVATIVDTDNMSMFGGRSANGMSQDDLGRQRAAEEGTLPIMRRFAVHAQDSRIA